MQELTAIDVDYNLGKLLFCIACKRGTCPAKRFTTAIIMYRKSPYISQAVSTPDDLHSN